MEKNFNKTVTKLTDLSIDTIESLNIVTTEQLQREFDYFIAKKILNNMLEKGLISDLEFKKIDVLNRKSFSPSLADIMP